MHNFPALSLADDLEHNAFWHGDHPAYVQDKRQTTHKQLLASAKQLSSALYNLGVRSQDRVGILSMNSIEFGEIFAATQWAGFILSTVNFRLAAAEMVWIINDSAPKVLFFEHRYAEIIQQIKPELNAIETYICIDGSVDWAENYPAFLNAGDPQGPPIKGSEEDASCLIYTSGTTGRPKGCLWGQREFRQVGQLDANTANIQQPDRILIVMPMFHIGGLTLMLSQHCRGGTVHLHQQFDAQAVIDDIENNQLTVLLLAPTMIRMVLENPSIKQRDLSSVRVVIYSAAPMPSTLLLQAIEVFNGCDFINMFGQTEVIPCSLTALQHKPKGSDEDRKRLLSIGQPYPDMKIRIIDENGNDCPGGETGELLAKGVTMFRGYWNNSPASIDTLRDGWVHTGDMARIEDGFIYLVDRKKDVIISGGENIYSREVEEAIIQHPSISQCAIIGLPDEKWGETVCAIVTLKDNQQVSEEDIIHHTKALIASYKKPHKVIFVDELPQMVTGKIDKKALRRLYVPNYQP